MGSRLLVVDPAFSTVGLRMYDDTSNTWSAPADGPVRFYFSQRLWTGTELWYLPADGDFGAPGLAFEPATGRWRTLDSAPGARSFGGVFWTGSAAVGLVSGVDDFGVYRYENDSPK